MEEINNFIKTIMEKDLEEGKVSQIVTRFRHALKRESPKREQTTCQDLSYFLCLELADLLVAI